MAREGGGNKNVAKLMSYEEKKSCLVKKNGKLLYVFFLSRKTK